MRTPFRQNSTLCVLYQPVHRLSSFLDILECMYKKKARSALSHEQSLILCAHQIPKPERSTLLHEQMKRLLFTSYEDMFFRTAIFCNVHFKNFVEQIKGYKFIKGLKYFTKQNPTGWQTTAPPAYQGGKWMPCMRLKAITNDKRTTFYSNFKKYILAR